MADYGGRRRIQMNDSIPDDIATECLVRIPLRFHSTLKLVSHGWRSLLSHPSFYSHRLLSGSAEHLLFLVQPLPSTSDPPLPPSDPKPDLRRRPDGPPVYAIGVFNLTRREWHRLTLSPPLRIPMFCQLVALPAAAKLLLLGGWDPETLDPVDHVYVIDLVAGTWSRGAPMAAARSFFAVSVAADRHTVYVAGGHDGQKNALRSAEAYDADADAWAPLPPMEEERDECLGMPFGGGFLVVSGYATDRQGRFRQDAEWFDPERGHWSRLEAVWPSETTSPRTTAVGSRGRWWWAEANGEVKEFDWEEMGWKGGRKMGPMPPGLGGSCRCVIDVGGDGFVAMGNGGNRVFVVEAAQQQQQQQQEEQESVWKNVETPPEFLGIPFSTCNLRL